MRRDFKSFTKSCDICQGVKYLNQKIESGNQFLGATRPNELVSVDFLRSLSDLSSGSPIPIRPTRRIFEIGIDIFYCARDDKSRPE